MRIPPIDLQRLVVDLAGERVPCGVIARATGTPLSDVFSMLRVAKERGELIEIPAADWRPGLTSRGEDPGASLSHLKDRVTTVARLAKAHWPELTPNCASVLAYMIINRQASRQHLLRASGTEGAQKVLDVMIYRVRRALGPQYPIITITGMGYAMSFATQKQLKDLLRTED